MSYRIAGIDVHKKMLAVVVSDVEVDGEYQFERVRYSSSPEHLRFLADWLMAQQVEEVVMESTHLAPNFHLHLRHPVRLLKPSLSSLPPTIGQSQSNTHSPPRPSQTPATSFNRLYRKSRHWPRVARNSCMAGPAIKY